MMASSTPMPVMDPKTIEIAALGRALYPGMVYDCRSDSFIPGVTLWDNASLTQELDVRQKPNTDLKFSASETLSEKASLLDVSASLKASFLGGLLEVGGSAKYLRDQKTSAYQSRVTMLYSQTTRFEQLTMTQLGKITYPEVFEEKTATHVVTAVLYGAQAFMVFDKTVSENEDKQEVEGNLNVMVKKIPLLSIEGEGDLKMNDKEKELAENISCTFYGDCVLEENPTTYMEALQLYKKLPSLLREHDGVPLRVWLYPLARLDTKAAKLEREISAILISKVEGILEELGEAERRYNDLVKNRTVHDFQDVRQRLQTFQELLCDYKVLFQKVLCRLLPAIRGGDMTEQALSDILLIHGRSLFRANRLKQWLENVQTEIELLSSYTSELSGVPVITSLAQFNSSLFNPTVDTVVCFSFTSLKYEDPYLSAITEFLKVDEFEKLSAGPISGHRDIKFWFYDHEISERMKENLFLFKSFFEANKEKTKTRFVIASVPDSTNPGASIHLYRNGKMVDSNFQPVSKPPAPIVDIQAQNLILEFQKSSTGVTVRYRVEHRVTQPDESGADAEAWETKDTPDAQETFVLTGLQTNQYSVRYRAVSDVGVSEASNSVPVSFQANANVTVNLSLTYTGVKGMTNSSLYNGLRNEITATLGTSPWSSSTIQAEVTNQVSKMVSNIMYCEAPVYSKQSIPYVGAIPARLKPGMALYFQGVVDPDAKRRLVINLKTGPQESDDVINFYFCTSFTNIGPFNIWRKTGCCNYLPEGSAFDIFIVITTEGYLVYVNGGEWRMCLHNHPVSIETVTTLDISGDVSMNTFGLVPKWRTSTFNKELSPGISRCKLQTSSQWQIQSATLLTILMLIREPYVGPITGGLRAGLILFFQGVVPSDSDGFAINLKTGPRDADVAFRFNPRFRHFDYIRSCSVVCDSFRNKQWEDPEMTREEAFARGGAFDIFMAIYPERYEVAVNGHINCSFKHRIPSEKVCILNIDGDVFMKTFRIITVSHYYQTAAVEASWARDLGPHLLLQMCGGDCPMLQHQHVAWKLLCCRQESSAEGGEGCTESGFPGLAVCLASANLQIMEPKTIEMAALGRALYPGMLYDCRSDSFIPGVTLWDKASLTQDLYEHQKPNTDLKFSASETLSEKANLLDVSASLKASFLGGLVEVGGSAKYLRDQKTSAYQSRVTMLYSQTTKFKHLTMTQLGKITYPKVFEEKTATHVVTAVLYGAQAFMVFDKTVSENENKQEIEGNLNLMVKKIPLLSIEGEGDLKMNEKEKKLAENISCTFYGDCVLEESPTTYKEALQLYKKLPSLLREHDGVPLRVWLYPLARLNKKAAKLEREISGRLISNIEDILEELGEAERRYNDLVKNRTVHDFQDVRQRLQTFQELLCDYKVLFQKVLCRLLPAIRGGDMTEQALTHIRLIHGRSLFRANRLKQWLENVQTEIELLSSYTSHLRDVPVITSLAQFNSSLFNPTVDTVVCFSFTSLKYEDPYLSAITEFLKVDEFEKLSAGPISGDADIKFWFYDHEISERMKEKLFLFISFFEANKEKTKTRFVIASVSDSSNPGTSIHLYRNGKLVDNNFQPVSKPPAPIVDIQDQNLILEFQKSSTGVTVRYRVEHRVIQPDESGADAEAWETKDTPDAQETFVLTGLQTSQYWVRYRAISDVGVSEASDSVPVSFQANANVTVNLSWGMTNSSLYNGLRNEVTAILGTSPWSSSTIQAEVTNRVSKMVSNVMYCEAPVYSKQSIPYVGAIPERLKPGMALYFQGVVDPDAKRRYVFLISIPEIHMKCMLIDVLNFTNSWRLRAFIYSIETRCCNYLPKGSAFDIFIVITTEGYQVYVNGGEWRMGLHNHPVSIETVTRLDIRGDVSMNIFGLVPNWRTSTFHKELSPGISRCKLRDLKSQVANPVCNPREPYVGPITGGLRAGLILFFQGVVPSDSDGFAINLKTGPRDADDVAFRFSPRFRQYRDFDYIRCSVVCDSFRNEQWEDPEIALGEPFARGGAFDIFMAIYPERYEVAVNGHINCSFKHRIPPEKVCILNIDGDVFMNTFRIITVSHYYQTAVHIIKHQKPNTNLKFSASETLSEKANLLDVSASLKASFLGGLVEVGGSAKYLRDQKTSAYQSRVTMLYSQTTKFKNLTMTQLGKITYPKVFEEKTATHVVTAVLYGARAFMVFDKTVSKNENKQEIEGNLNLMVKKIPLLSIEGKGDLKMNDKEKELAENISCTFYGDCVLEENPTTYMEALQLYKKLPSLLREHDGVPLRVWLYPLACLDTKAAKLEREISAILISNIEDILEELGDAERRYNDLVKNRTVHDFQDVKQRLQTFQELLGNYKVLFQKVLCRLLPAIRGGDMTEHALNDILLIHGRSLFRANRLKQWLENVQTEIELLSSYTSHLRDVPVITSLAQFNSSLLNPTVDTVVCFSFTSLKYEDPYLSAITEFLKVDEFEKLSAGPISGDADIKFWFYDHEISERMKENLFLFKSFFEANKEKTKTRFVIASVPDSTNPGTSIHLYRNGKLVDSNFQPVSKPPAPIVDIQAQNLILQFQKPLTGVTVRYRVEHRVTQSDESGADAEAWETKDTPDAQETFVLKGLQTNQYSVRYRAVSDVGVSEASDSVLLFFQEKVDVQVDLSWVSKDLITLTVIPFLANHRFYCGIRMTVYNRELNKLPKYY
ncbi:hypothetical protein NFI96_017381 [Prochilodus magdalenae]|nr:hypothetical protein NFI96_017381 [Prochilodus magdalenae]